MKSFHRPEKKIWNYIKTCGRNLFCVHESCNIWGCNFMCLAQLTEDGSSPCTIPGNLTAFQSWTHTLANTTSTRPHCHPREIHLAASSSPCVPQTAHSPLADGSTSCSLFPRRTNARPCEAPYRGALNQGQLAPCQHTIQTPAKAVLAAINPFRAAKQVRDLKEYSSAWIMINSMVAKVPEALAGSVCVQAHMSLRQWESLSVLSPENPLQGQSLSPGGLFTQSLWWPSVPDCLCTGGKFPAAAF